MTKVKICGLTTFSDSLAAAQAGADMLGFNFYKRSPRYIDPADALKIAEALRAELGAALPALVGVFVNEGVGNISMTMGKVGFKIVQLSGDESVELLRELRGTAFKAIRPRSPAEAQDDAAYFAPGFASDERIPSLLLDAHHPDLYGGTGTQASLDIVRAVKETTPRVMLAGGLTPTTVADIVRAVQPWGVDVASGVEIDGTPGRKDAGKVRAFIEAVHSVT